MPEQVQKKTIPPYEPHVRLEGVYEKMSASQYSERVLSAIRHGFGLPREVLRQAFRDLLQKTINTEYPKMRCSVARAVFERRKEGLTDVIGAMPPTSKQQYENMLCAMDALETMMAVQLETDAAEAVDAFNRELGAKRHKKQKN